MNFSNLNLFIKKCKIDFMHFMDIKSMPSFQIQYRDKSLETARKQGVFVPAVALYDIPTGMHTLEISPTICQSNFDYIIFHEFTHILDTETYSRRNKERYFSNRAYTEYHAAQIEFMKLLDIENIKKSYSFSMNQRFQTIEGDITALEYVENKHTLAASLISKEDFPTSIEALITTLGIIFNYYGIRSVCKMYAVDYIENVDKYYIAKLINKDVVDILDTFMVGFIDEIKIVASIDLLYYKMAHSLVQMYSLS